MSKETTILDCYTDVIESLGGEVDDEGRVHICRPDGETIPSVVNEKPLYLPTKKLLMVPGIMDQYQFFHPLSESLPRKTISPVMEYLQKQATWVISFYVTTIARRILETAADPALHAELPPDASEFLKRLSNANEKTVNKFGQLIRKASQKKRLVSVYCKSGGKFQGSPVTRMCTIRFPIMDMLETGDMKELKVAFSSNKERETLKQLFHYVLPMGDDPEEYSAFSNAKIAPFFEAFLKAYEKIVTQLNKMVARHGDVLGMGLEPIATGAFKHFDKIPTYYSNSGLSTIPGNEGGIQEMQAANKAQSSSNQLAESDHPKAYAETPTAPSTTRQTAPPATDPASDMDAFMRSLRGTPAQPSYAQPPQPQGGYYQQPPPPPVHNPYSVVLQGGYGTPQPAMQQPPSHYVPGQHRQMSNAYAQQGQAPNPYAQQQGYPQQPQPYGQQGGYAQQPPPWNDTGSL